MKWQGAYAESDGVWLGGRLGELNLPFDA